MKHFKFQKFGIGLCLILQASVLLHAQAPSWTWARTAGSTGWDYAGGVDYNSSTIATDAQGNSYVTGSVIGAANFGAVTVTASSSSPEVFVAKYDANGICLWVRHFGGNGGVYDNEGKSVDLDASGNCYVTGNFHGSSGNTITFGSSVLTCTGHREIFVVKYDANGNEQWAVQPSGSHVSNNYAKSIAVDASGNSYITGYLGGGTNTFGSAGLSGPGAYVVKHNSSGVAQWATKLGSGNADGICLAIDGNGNSYVSGYLQGTEMFSSSISLTSSGGRDVLVAKVSSAGNLAWAKNFGGTASSGPSSNLNAYGKGVSVDGSGNVFLTGAFGGNVNFGSTSLVSGLTSGETMYVAKLDANGAALWANAATGTANSNVAGSGAAIKANNAGDCFFTGYYTPSSTQNSNPQTFCGITLPNVGNQIAYVIKINANGSTDWGQFSSGQGSSALPAGISIDPANNVYIAGNDQGTAVIGSTTITSNGGFDVLVAKIGNAAITSTLTTGLAKSEKDADVTIYPNPFNVSVTLTVKGYEANGTLDLKLYNVLGELVRSYTGIASSTFTFDKGEMASGIYSYVLSQRNTVLKTGKIVAQ